MYLNIEMTVIRSVKAIPLVLTHIHHSQNNVESEYYLQLLDM